MIWIVIVVLVTIFFGGLARLLLFVRGQTTSMPNSERLLDRKKGLSLGIAGIACSSFGLFFLLSRVLEPLEILIGVVLVVSLMEVAIRSGTTKVAD